jgi:hypothetical protein
MCARVQNKCVVEFTTGDLIAGCKQGDIACICSNKDFLDGIACCLVDDCDDASQKAAVDFARGLCTGAGVQVPNEIICKEGGSSSTSAAPSSSTTDGSASSSPSATETETGAGSEATTSSPNAGSAATPFVGGIVGAAFLAANFL